MTEAHTPTRKGGISWPVQELTSDPIAKFFMPGSLSWHYNWNKNWKQALPNTSKDIEIKAEFVPMMWSTEFVYDTNNELENWEYLLGFNEPDLDDPSVASRASPSEAAKAYIDMAKLRTSPHQMLVSPAVAHNKEWMKEFLNLLPLEAKPNILAIHVYTTTFDSFRSIVESYHKEFGLPIMVTEFAMQSFDPSVPPPVNQQQVHDYMGQTTKWLDETDWIVRYCWFGAVRDPANLHGVHPFNRLMDEHGNLTPLGHQYITGGHD